MASGPGVLQGGFHKPGQGQARATGLPHGPRQEELAADVSPCANLWLLASGAFYPPACLLRTPGAWQGPEAPMPGLGLCGWTDWPPWPWVPRAQRWSLVRGWQGAGLELRARTGGGGEASCSHKVSSIAWSSAVTTLGDLALCHLSFPMCTPKGPGGCFGVLCPWEVVNGPCLPTGLPGTQRWLGEVLWVPAGQTGAAWAPESHIVCVPSAVTSLLGCHKQCPPHGDLERLPEGAHRKRKACFRS